VVDYAEAGIREYWIADARKQPLVFRVLVLGSGGTYRDSEPDADGWLWSPIWQRHFRVRPIVDRLGAADFVLDIR
jgi:Uma2 family endonuclease